MYEIRFFRRSDRRLLPRTMQRTSLPVAPEMDGRSFAEAISTDGKQEVYHWNGRRWLHGPLPGRNLDPARP
jgi:hypothetical protein